MVQTNKVKETSETGIASKNGSPDDQLVNVRRLLKLLTGLFVGHVILSIVAATTLGFYVNEHIKEINLLKQQTGVLQISKGQLLERMVTLEADMNQHKEEFLDYLERVDIIGDIITSETDVTNTSDVQMLHIRLVKLETNQMAVNISITEIQSDQYNDRETIMNNTYRVTRLERVMDNQTSSADLEDRLNYLESDIINKTQSDIEDNKSKISALGRNMTEIMAFKNDQLLRNDKIESNISSIQDTLKSYNETVEKLKDLESMQILDETTNNMQDDRLFDIENTTANFGHMLQNHTTVLSDLTDALNCTWGNWTKFSTCTHSCGGGIKYRTRSCQNTNPLREVWLSKTDIDIEQCNTHNCTDSMSAFAIYAVYPTFNASNGVSIFTSTKLNIGGHYDTVTGVYTCFYPGVYVFSLNLYKKSGTDEVACYIYKNYSVVAIANVPSESNSGFYESSASTVIHLDFGDTVYVGFCDNPDNIDSFTSFTGFLLHAD